MKSRNTAQLFQRTSHSDPRQQHFLFFTGGYATPRVKLTPPSSTRGRATARPRVGGGRRAGAGGARKTTPLPSPSPPTSHLPPPSPHLPSRQHLSTSPPRPRSLPAPSRSTGKTSPLCLPPSPGSAPTGARGGRGRGRKAPTPPESPHPLLRPLQQKQKKPALPP